MPIYQYDCGSCGRRVDVFFRSAAAASNPVCPRCGGKRLKRVMSMFARARSTKQRLEDIDHVREAAALQSGDVGSFARWARQAGSEWDEELGTNYRELAERAEAGEDPVERIDADYTFRYKVNEKLSALNAPPDAPPAVRSDPHEH